MLDSISVNIDVYKFSRDLHKIKYLVSILNMFSLLGQNPFKNKFVTIKLKVPWKYFLHKAQFCMLKYFV